MCVYVYCLCTLQADYESKLTVLETDRLDKEVESLSSSEKEDMYKNGTLYSACTKCMA